MSAIIEVQNVSKSYHVGKIDVPALRNVSFVVERGEFVAVLGPSGSGKSTLFYVLGGLTHADTGRVLVDGADFSAMSDAERTKLRKTKIGFVFQKFNLLPTLDAQTNIKIAQNIAGNKNHDSGVLPQNYRTAGDFQAPGASSSRTLGWRTATGGTGASAHQQTCNHPRR